MPKKIEIPPGTMYGRLKVLHKHPERLNGRVQWVCECQCEEKNIVLVQTKNLRNGKTRSCGCYQKERVKETHPVKAKNILDLTGRQFDYLTVKRKITGLGSNTVWECECVCGIIKPIRQSQLTSGKVISCGCKNRKYAKENVNINTGKVFGTSISIIASKKVYSTNTSGVKGVTWHKKTNKWMAYIHLGKKYKNLGYYDDLEEATKVRQEAEEQRLIDMKMA